MKITPQFQGYRVRHSSWPVGRYVLVRKVSKGQTKQVTAIDATGALIVLQTSDDDQGWTKLKQGEHHE